ncbi:GRP family sugar transporter [Sphingobacterium sp. HJSM2_6]|uniref:GRP family sugar transporter n=1 Tax=Sphingobacterium sp. HJSM2_6 TaxID=3366264 RepID=UPI003BCA19B5
MFIVTDYYTAVFFCIITMLCWGSWANTQKMTQNKWRFELFYWDYVLGILFFSLLSAFTLGSLGESGRPFLADLSQTHHANILNALVSGVLFNLANILLTAAIASAGMSIAFPIGIGIALVAGVFFNYLIHNQGNEQMLIAGVALVTIAIIVNAIAYKKHQAASPTAAIGKWITVSIIAGLLMSLFYPFLASGMDLNNFEQPMEGKMTPYTAFVIFAFGIFLSNIIFNSILMRRPLAGPPINYSEYFSGKIQYHLIGLLGGAIWGLGNIFNLLAAGMAGPAISYGLGQGATLIAALWGVLVWKEFKNASPKVNLLLLLMFILFILGIGLIIWAGS